VPRAWPTLTLLTGVALATGYLAGRRGKQGASPPADVATGRSFDARDRAAAASGLRQAGPLAESAPEHHRLRPDVLLGPVLLVMIGIIVDRLRESDAGESVTAWLLILGATIAAPLARSAGYGLAARGFYCFLVGFSWAAAALYVQAGPGADRLAVVVRRRPAPGTSPRPAGPQTQGGPRGRRALVRLLHRLGGACSVDLSVHLPSPGRSRATFRVDLALGDARDRARQRGHRGSHGHMARSTRPASIRAAEPAGDCERRRQMNALRKCATVSATSP
jgi:hypothetical protein